MFKSGFLLDTPAKIDAAIFNRSIVVVIHDGEIVHTGVIDRQDDASVHFADGYYFLRENCMFRIKQCTARAPSWI